MWAFDYLREKGIKRALAVLYQYKIDLFMQKILSIIYRNASLKNIIVIMSHDDFDCNGGAFYDYLIKEGYNEKYKIVWILNHDVPKNLPNNVYGFKYLRPSVRKDYYICRAKVFTADDIIIKKVREDQKSYYFTHGHGGIAIKNVKGIIMLPDFVDYCLISSYNTAKSNSDSLGLSYPNKIMINLGFPSNDALFEPDIKISNIIDKDKFDFTILWMPTFRKQWTGRNDSNREYEYGIPLIESRENMNKLKRYLVEKNYCLIIKIHPMQARESYIKLKQEQCRNLLVFDSEDMKSKNITNQQLYILSDLMLNDYSGAMWPCMLLNKPMGFIFSDLSDYKLGLSMSNPDEIMIGKKIYTFEELLQFVDESAHGNDPYLEKRTKVRKYLFDYIDGNSCERIAKHMGL